SDAGGLPDAGPGAPAAQLALGHGHTCARLTDGTVRCWGSNVAGELGDGTQNSRAYGYPILYMNDVVELGVQTDGHRTCVRRSSGVVLCWGAVGDDLGVERCELDAPKIYVGCVLSPLPIPGPTTIVGLGVGDETCVRLASGDATCLSATPGAVNTL